MQLFHDMDILLMADVNAMWEILNLILIEVGVTFLFDTG